MDEKKETKKGSQCRMMGGTAEEKEKKGGRGWQKEGRETDRGSGKK